MNLVIDIGNSLQKSAVFDKAREPIHVEVCAQITPQLLESLFAQFPIRNCIFSAVADFDKSLLTFLEKKCRVFTFSQSLRFPLEIRYEHAETLGSDRLANAVAAHLYFPDAPVLSIQAGSCIVADFVDENGIYWGGSISPGLNMRFRALNRFTSNLPLLEPQEIDFYVGTSSEKSIRSGVINGVTDEINSLIERYMKDYANLKVFLTGGDSAYLHKSIKNTIFANSNLVLIGLNKILEFNVDEK